MLFDMISQSLFTMFRIESLGITNVGNLDTVCIAMLLPNKGWCDIEESLVLSHVTFI